MSDLIDQLGYLSGGSRLRKIYEKMQIGGDKAYSEAEIEFKSTWFPVYYVLSKSKQPQTVMGITNQITFSHITVKNIIKELERENLVEVIPNPHDKRSKLISLSDKGYNLLKQLKPLWAKFSYVLKDVLTAGHPDILNILQRIDHELISSPLNERVKKTNNNKYVIVDYYPELKPYLFELAGYWLSGFLKGKLEDSDEFSLHNPNKEFIEKGGFVFFARYQNQVIGCVALKRLDKDMFECDYLFVEPKFRNHGIATKLIEKCITRCNENYARALWVQTPVMSPEVIKLLDHFDFVEMDPPEQMNVHKRTEKILSHKFNVD